MSRRNVIDFSDEVSFVIRFTPRARVTRASIYAEQGSGSSARVARIWVGYLDCGRVDLHGLTGAECADVLCDRLRAWAVVDPTDAHAARRAFLGSPLRPAAPAPRTGPRGEQWTQEPLPGA